MLIDEFVLPIHGRRALCNRRMPVNEILNESRQDFQDEVGKSAT